MEKELAHVIWNAQNKANIEPIKNFAAQLSSNDTIITFNYDTLVEHALSEEDKVWNHGLNDLDNGGITVLKMHGSIDWILLERRKEKELEKFIKLFSKKDVNVKEHNSKPLQEEEYTWELWRAKDTTICNAVLEMDQGGLSTFKYRLGLAGLGQYKPLHRLPGSAETWFSAFKALKNADEIIVIGFSMSPYDTMTRFHFASVVRGCEKPPSRIIIIDPNAISLANAFSSVFGIIITLIASKAEQVDYSKLLV
ncbi:MAG: SIR2 family protein [Planctomycetota bacterium]